MLLRRVARPLLSVAFIGQGLEALRNPRTAAEAARPLSAVTRRLPSGSRRQPEIERIAGINACVQIGGGILLASGKMPRVAAAVLTATVIPGNLGVHMFWNEDDPERRARKRRDFLTDASLLGGLLIAAADTAGKPSLGWRSRRAAERLSDAVSAALPIGDSDSSLPVSEFGERLSHGLRVGAERGRELIGAATEKTEPLIEAARRRGSELAAEARERGSALAQARPGSPG